MLICMDSLLFSSEQNSKQHGQSTLHVLIIAPFGIRIWSAVVMRAWQIFFYSVSNSILIALFCYFLLLLVCLLHQNAKMLNLTSYRNNANINECSSGT